MKPFPSKREIIDREFERSDILALIRLHDPQGIAWWAEPYRECLESLWDTDSTFGTSLVDLSTGQVVAAALSAFLTPEFSAFVLETPVPYVHQHALHWFHTGRVPLHPSLDRAPEAAAREAKERGLHLHNFVYHWVQGPGMNELLDLQAGLAMRYFDRYVGMRLRIATVECVGQSWIAHAVTNHLLVKNPYRDWSEPACLMGVSREEAGVSGNQWLMGMFAPGPPKVDLNPKERRILFHLRNDLSDSEIAERVFLAKGSIKTSFDRIFDAFADAIPGFFDLAPDRKPTYKRRMVLRYLRTHPEECWPYG